MGSLRMLKIPGEQTGLAFNEMNKNVSNGSAKSAGEQFTAPLILFSFVSKTGSTVLERIGPAWD